MTKKRNLAWLIAIALLCLSAKPVMAGVGVNGAVFKAEGNPGDLIYHDMIVSIGENDSAKNISAQLVGFGQTLDGAYMALEPDNETISCSACPFLHLNLTEFYLEPGSSETVTMTGRIPEDVGDGGRYALVQIRSQSKSEKSISVAVGVDVPVLLAIKDTELIHTGDITNLDYEIKEIESGQEIDVSLIFKNTGNHHYKANVKAAIEDDAGNVLSEASIPLGFTSIIPPNSRESKLTLRPNGELASEIYNLAVIVTEQDGTVLVSEEITLEI